MFVIFMSSVKILTLKVHKIIVLEIFKLQQEQLMIDSLKKKFNYI